MTEFNQQEFEDYWKAIGKLSLIVIGVVFAIVLVFFVPMGKGFFKGEPVKGTVLDIESTQPIAGASVIAIWAGYLPGPAHSSSVCYYVMTATSDQNGKFETQPWKENVDGWRKRVKAQEVIVHAYKAGYRLRKYGKDNKYLMQAVIGTREERIEDLIAELRNTRCIEQFSAENHALDYQRAIVAEWEQLVETDQEKRDFLSVVYGYMHSYPVTRDLSLPLPETKSEGKINSPSLDVQEFPDR